MRTIRRWLISVVSAGVAIFSGSLLAQQSESLSQLKENLDLPFDVPSLEQNDEEALHTLYFYGQIYEGNGFVFIGESSL